MSGPWEDRVDRVVARLEARAPVDVIGALADLAFEVPEARGDAWLDARADREVLRDATTRLYYTYIVDNETQDVARLLGQEPVAGRTFRDMVTDKGRVAYDRVADMFTHIDFARCRRMAMIGCGQLPVTALHVMERTGVAELHLLDISPKAIESTGALARRFGWERLHPHLCDGKDFDYAGYDVVYVANMVRDKPLTVQRILATAPRELQLVVRDPYSLGCLWAEKAEHAVPGSLELLGKGAVSRHLSRDLYYRRAT